MNQTGLTPKVEPPTDGLSLDDAALADWTRCGMPHLLGQYRPVHDEIDATDLLVEGELPEGLTGSYLRNGPNPLLAPHGPYHLFPRCCTGSRWVTRVPPIATVGFGRQG